MPVNCIECGTKLIGRADKRYCSDHCRSSHYNKSHKESLGIIKDVNKLLRKNYKILKELNPNGKRKIKRDDLIATGFNFSYLTSFYRTKTNKTYYYVYDQGYVALDDDYFALVLKEEYIK